MPTKIVAEAERLLHDYAEAGEHEGDFAADFADDGSPVISKSVEKPCDVIGMGHDRRRGRRPIIISRRSIGRASIYTPAAIITEIGRLSSGLLDFMASAAAVAEKRPFLSATAMKYGRGRRSIVRHRLLILYTDTAQPPTIFHRYVAIAMSFIDACLY